MAGLVKDALDKGAEPVVGGELEHEMGRSFFQPALLAGCTLDMRVSHEEIFGPVVGVMKFTDEAEALAMSNRRVYFCTLGVCFCTVASIIVCYRVCFPVMQGDQRGVLML